MRIFLLLILLLFGCQSSKKVLYIYSWAEVIDPSIVTAFEKEFNCRVVIDTYDTNETLYAKIRTGAGGYDLIFPSYYFAQVMVKQHLIQPIDHAEIPNLRYLDKDAVRKMSSDVFSHTVPFFLSQTGLGYRRDRLPSFIPSWRIYENSDLRGRMTLLNDMRDVMGAALITLGYSPNTRSPNEIDEATTLIFSWKKNIAKFENEQYKNGIATAEFLVVQGFRGEVLQVSEENQNVGFGFPLEGSLLSYDLIAIPKDAREISLALAFINTLYVPENAAKNMEKIFERMPNTAAYELLPQALRGNPALFPSDEEMERAFLIEDLGEDILLYRRAWEKIKEDDL